MLWQHVNWYPGTQSDKPNNMSNDLKHVETHECMTNDSWTLWTEPQLNLFVFLVSFSLLLVSASLDCFSLFRWLHTALAHKLKAQYRIHPMVHAHVSSHCECCSWSLRLLHSLLLLSHHLSDHPAVPTAKQLQLPRCGGQIPCVLPLKTLAPWPRTSLPQVLGDLSCSHSTRTDSLLKTMKRILTPRQNRNVVRIQIVLALGEWSSARNIGPILKRCNARQ